MSDQEVINKSWRELHKIAKEKEAKVDKRISTLEAKLSSLESENRELRERVEDLERICEMQMMLILGLLPLGKELEGRLEFAISDEGMEHGRRSVKEMLENRRTDAEQKP